MSLRSWVVLLLWLSVGTHLFHPPLVRTLSRNYLFIYYRSLRCPNYERESHLPPESIQVGTLNLGDSLRFCEDRSGERSYENSRQKPSIIRKSLNSPNLRVLKVRPMEGTSAPLDSESTFPWANSSTTM